MKAYLIPGWGEDLKDRDYQAVLDVYKNAGYKAELISVDWNYKTIDDYVDEVRKKISKKDLRDSLLSGFSWGAMIALVLAAEYQSPKKLLLFSLSPYFAEDLPRLKKSWIDGVGKARLKAFKNLPMEPLAKKVNCPTLIFAGTQEGAELEHRVKEAHRLVTGSKLFMLDGVKHDVADRRYVEALRKELK